MSITLEEAQDYRQTIEEAFASDIPEEDEDRVNKEFDYLINNFMPEIAKALVYFIRTYGPYEGQWDSEWDKEELA